MNKTADRFEVKDGSRKPYELTSHQLRHNGITNRLYDGFSTVEIRDMTGGHVDDSVAYSYFHSVPEKNKEITTNMDNKKEPKEPIYSKGRILNLDKKTEEKILRNPRAYKITDGKDTLGICTDVTSCPSGKFDCLDCDFFAPKVENIQYFENQVRLWEGNQGEALENVKYNLCYKAILLKIQKRDEEKLLQHI